MARKRFPKIAVVAIAFGLILILPGAAQADSGVSLMEFFSGVSRGFGALFFGQPGPNIPTKAFFTNDDGATFFADDINKIPPFQKDGKEAVRCQVYTCDRGKTKFVAYLERYTPEAKVKLEKLRASTQPESEDLSDMNAVMMGGMEYKKPGKELPWISQTDFTKVQAVIQPRCPDGGNMENLEPVRP